eukprot:CAMPEP_0197499138 /NCGR_PEP_ID=MMETSP1311-20131121/60869_1 /TAXON_ID=464262 /ORGANISM="Genus nov. species nov., Strain RCC856" /LENGTH=104 /DNA_ID=CAMNT_0043044881 /DNA_START=13 /DNA_END=327 /DNA_ORIENTATION=+
MAQARGALRELLRALSRYSPDNQDFKKHVLSEFRRNAAMKDEREVARLVALTKDYTFLVTSVNSHLDLLLDCNISTDRASRQRETVKKIARRVGLKTSYEDDLD